MFKSGHSKVGWRKRGSKNKKTLLSADELLLKLDVNPIERLINIAESNDASVERKMHCWQEIAKYTYPKLKSQEIYVEEDRLPESIEVHLVSSDGTREAIV